MSVLIGEPSRTAAGNVVNPRANNAREQILTSQIMDWTLRGWVFSASQGVLATDIASITTEDDITPTASLQSPYGGEVVVIPLRVRASITDDGGALTTLDLLFTQAAAECATPLTLTGTTLNIQNHYTPNPSVTSKATALYTVTSSALATTDQIGLAHYHWIHNALTTALVIPDFDYEFTTPLALRYGAALLLYTVTTTTAGRHVITFTWAEIPSLYVP